MSSVELASNSKFTKQMRAEVAMFLMLWGRSAILAFLTNECIVNTSSVSSQKLAKCLSKLVTCYLGSLLTLSPKSSALNDNVVSDIRHLNSPETIDEELASLLLLVGLPLSVLKLDSILCIYYY